MQMAGQTGASDVPMNGESCCSYSRAQRCVGGLPARRPRTICIRATPENNRKTETAPVRAGDKETECVDRSSSPEPGS
jgi:hypothetical protein